MDIPRPTVVVAGLGDTGVLVATRLARTCRVVGMTTPRVLVSGEERGTRLTDPPRWRRTYLVPFRRFRRLLAVDLATIDAALDDVHRQLARAATVAVVGGGATGTAVTSRCPTSIPTRGAGSYGGSPTTV